jgi:hypothetical protein
VIQKERPKYVDGIEVPRVMLGTSPFLGAGQFGPRARKYYRHFYLNPANIANLIVEAAEFDITWVQAIARAPIAKAIEEARRHTQRQIQIAATVGVEQFEPELELMKNLNAKIILTHARITDGLDSDFRDCINRISDIAIAGAVTHNPGITIPELSSYDEVKIIMAPINLAGWFMNPSASSTLDAIDRTDKIVVGKKTLAAGLLQPREALEYVAQYVYGVAIGVASTGELKETFGIAKEIWKVGKA